MDSLRDNQDAKSILIEGFPRSTKQLEHFNHKVGRL